MANTWTDRGQVKRQVDIPGLTGHVWRVEAICCPICPESTQSDQGQMPAQARTGQRHVWHPAAPHSYRNDSHIQESRKLPSYRNDSNYWITNRAKIATGPNILNCTNTVVFRIVYLKATPQCLHTNKSLTGKTVLDSDREDRGGKKKKN